MRYVRNDNDVITVKIANQLLDSGKNIEQILNPEHGLLISVVVSCDGSYALHVRCFVKAAGAMSWVMEVIGRWTSILTGMSSGLCSKATCSMTEATE